MRRLIVTVIFLLLIGSIAAGYYYYLGLTVTVEAPGPKLSEIEAAGRHLVSKQISNQGYKIALSVPGSHPDADVFALRGTLFMPNKNSNNDGAPFFATLTAACQAWSELACWRLKSIFIAGVEQSVIESITAPPSSIKQTDDNSRRKSAPGAAPETNVKQASKLTIPTDKTDEKSKTGLTAPQQKSTAPINTAVNSDQRKWQTIHNRVNARSGPGTNHTAYFKMPNSVALRLLKVDQNWGMFEYSAVNGKAHQVWISMSLVKLDTKAK